jgi:hypothetical protein
MGYSHLKTVDQTTQSKLNEILHAVLRDCNCENLDMWVESIIQSGHFRVVSDKEESLYCVDENDDLLSMTFPAMLDVKGEYSRISPYFSLENYDKVSFFLRKWSVI